jgi:hypothetical protein
MDLLCPRCEWPHHVCPCRLNETTELQVQRRHRDSVRLATAHGWAGNARRPHIDAPGLPVAVVVGKRAAA